MSQGSLVEEATVSLRQWLESSQLKPGSIIPVERILAQELGLKPYAINRAVNSLIAEGQIKREGYRLSLINPAKALRNLSFDLILAQRSVYLKSYRRVAKELEVSLNVHPWTCLEEAVEFLRQLDSPKTQCVIFDPPFALSASLWEPAAVKLIQHGIPVVSIGQYTRKVPCVLSDYPRALELALSHLTDLGHKEIAFATVPPISSISSEMLDAWSFLGRRYGLRAPHSRVFLQNNPMALREDAGRLAKKLVEEWSQVTTVIVYGVFEPAVQHLMEELKQRGKQVPRDISLIFLSDLTHPHIFNPPLSTVSVDMALMQETAFVIGRRMVEKAEDGKSLASSWLLRLEPSLVHRASIGPTSSFISPVQASSGKVKPPPFELGLLGKPKDLKRELEFVLRRAYDLTAKAAVSRFTSIDLKPHVNRPLNYRRGWLGDLPLKHFSAGEHVIHGIPFEVLGGSARSDCGAVVFRSAINTKGNMRELPSRLSIKIGAKARAIYFLHGCGYSSFLQPFATYGFYAGKNRLGSVPLVTLGQPPVEYDNRKISKKALQANIQDWWADFYQMDFPHARRVPIIEHEGEEPLHRHVYLYTLEWINPCPDREITHIEITADPERSTTLGLLGVTLLGK